MKQITEIAQDLIAIAQRKQEPFELVANDDQFIICGDTACKMFDEIQNNKNYKTRLEGLIIQYLAFNYNGCDEQVTEQWLNENIQQSAQQCNLKPEKAKRILHKLFVTKL